MLKYYVSIMLRHSVYSFDPLNLQPGMKDIESISEIIERLYVPGVKHNCVPLHSDLPLEDQALAVFGQTEDEVRVIIATNAAESSITLPDCDHVICTGLQKQITYNASSHRQMLLPCWISRASARQRSGRVGRVRPGTVVRTIDSLNCCCIFRILMRCIQSDQYRLYTKEAYHNMMKEFESGEMLRMPLDSVILMLKEILHEETTPALLNCLEPPDLSTIERSYESLHKANYISHPDDSGEITVLGAFVSALGIDLALGALIGLGTLWLGNMKGQVAGFLRDFSLDRYSIWGGAGGYRNGSSALFPEDAVASKQSSGAQTKILQQ
jgi:HrpA-like RNA helicase